MSKTSNPDFNLRHFVRAMMLMEDRELALRCGSATPRVRRPALFSTPRAAVTPEMREAVITVLANATSTDNERSTDQ
jgi:hypothetical protein